MAESDRNRCLTSSGPHRCSKTAGHTDECETVAPSTPWVGPAMRGTPRVVDGQKSALDTKTLPLAGARTAQERVSSPDGPTTPEDA